MTKASERWIRFLRQYGPIPRNDNMFDEHIRKSANRSGVRQISFKHPLEDRLLATFSKEELPQNAVLTGTAGDGKSHLCGRIWQALGGNAEEWETDEVYHRLQFTAGGRPTLMHVIRDLTALPDRDPKGRYTTKTELLEHLSTILFDPTADEVFLLAANDGQLIETWRKVASGSRALAVFEARLMDDSDAEASARLAFYNLSRVRSTAVLDLSLDAFLNHEGWQDCYADAEDDGFFGPDCPIRQNYELLKTRLVRSRLRSLFELCDFNDLHAPIRRVLMLLANAVLGHPEARDRLLRPRDIRGVLSTGTRYRSSLYSNLFGANLSRTKRESLEIFDYLGRFGIGHETTNRIDSILVFGSQDETLREHFDLLMGSDTFYGNTDRFRAAQQEYVQMPEAATDDRHAFVRMLIEQRRGLFFKIPDDRAAELRLWDLSVFTGAGEYLAKVAEPLRNGQRVSRLIIGRLVKGLNRIFTGMLVETERELLLATGLSFSGARISDLLADRISVAPRAGRPERVDIVLRDDFPYLDVHLPGGTVHPLRLNLTRYEFLARVGDGALPGNFSRECYEDILAFKSALLAAVNQELSASGIDSQHGLTFRLLSLDESGNPADDEIEVSRA
ncbi:MAG: hypothetical protein OXC19_18450 [Bryobacterales bacterium]|nr:hypothetical protein [Bryobacterales bacterium]